MQLLAGKNFYTHGIIFAKLIWEREVKKA